MDDRICRKCGGNMTAHGYNKYNEPRWWRCECEENAVSEPNTIEWYSEWVNELEVALANERASNALLETYNAALETERDQYRFQACFAETVIGELMHLLLAGSGEDSPEYARALALIGAPPDGDVSAPFHVLPKSETYGLTVVGPNSAEQSEHD